MQVFNLAYSPHPKQQIFHTVPANQILYGGAAGGGKTRALVEDNTTFCLENPGIQTAIFRRTLKELEQGIIPELKKYVPEELFSYNISKQQIEWINGSVTYFCYCDLERDIDRYFGAEFHIIYIDEAVMMTPNQLQMLRTRNRLGAFRRKMDAYDAERDKNNEPRQGHLLPRFVLMTNPVGGPGRQWIKKIFVDPAPNGLTIFNDKTTEYESIDTGEPMAGARTIYIPAKMIDNPDLDRDYPSKLRGMPPAMEKALRDGDWNVIQGGAFENLDTTIHKIPSLIEKIPSHWPVFMSMDWGTASPFSIGWYTVSDGTVLRDERSDPPRQIVIPENAIIRFAEWYGYDGHDDNAGIRWDSARVAVGILEREGQLNIKNVDYRVADYAMWAETDGPSPQENMMTETNGVITLQQSKKDRAANYNQFIQLLNGTTLSNGKKYPMFFATEDCEAFWRTLPALMLDENTPNKGPGPRQADHVWDEVQYAIASRPTMRTEEEFKEEIFFEAMEAANIDQFFDPYAIQ